MIFQLIGLKLEINFKPEKFKCWIPAFAGMTNPYIIQIVINELIF